MRRLILRSIGAPFVFLIPGIVLAQSSDNIIEGVLDRVTAALNAVIPFLALLATVLVLAGAVKYIAAGGDEEKVKEGRRLLFFGIVALAIIVTVWAFVDIVIDFFFQTRDFHIPGEDLVDPL